MSGFAANFAHISTRGLHTRTPLTCRRPVLVLNRTHSRRAVVTNAVRSSSREIVDDLIESDFYSILGVSPRADRKSIKQAYYNIMREYHPDSGADSTDFCAMLNDIYATLSDPCKRSVYNDMAGFSESAVNPFTDVSSERDLVTANQIPLLETAMSKMERSPVWILMSGGGSMQDVFSEASLAWAKRQSVLRQQILASKTESGSTHTTKSPGSSWWSWDNPFVDMTGANGASRYKSSSSSSSSSSSYDSTDDARGSYSGDSMDDESSCDWVGPREAKHIAGLAAKAARTARTWKKYQEVLRNARGGKRGMLPDASS